MSGWKFPNEDARDIYCERGEIEFFHVYFKYKSQAPEYVLSEYPCILAQETVRDYRTDRVGKINSCPAYSKAL